MQLTDQIPDSVKQLTPKQSSFLGNIVKLLQRFDNPEDLQTALHGLAKELGLSNKDAFSGMYQALIGKDYGPRAAWFLLQYPKDLVVERLQQASHLIPQPSAGINVGTIIRPEYFSINFHLKEAYPSVSVGIALIKGIKITKNHPNLEIENRELLDSLKGLSTEVLGTYPEILCYRKLYNKTNVDWHSRRPSPEALLRRVALGKGLYNINTCVDAYNLIVMKNRVSIGAFDADKVNFPTELRFAGAGDEILLLGDSEPTKYQDKEIAYYDQLGGYNIDYNYRDAQRTCVTEESKNIWLNVDGIFDITPMQVEKSLKESVNLITKYCGGSVEFAGVVI